MTYFSEKHNYYIDKKNNEVYLCRTNGFGVIDLMVSLTKMYGIGYEPNDVETVLKDFSIKPYELWHGLAPDAEKQELL